MSTALSSHLVEPERGAVLTKAALRAAERLGLSAAALAKVIGVSEATVSRMKRGQYQLEHSSKPYELAALLVRVYRSLDAVTGGDEAVARAWMVNANTVLGASPARKILSVTGLTDVAAYLDARRAIL
ncbi:MAG: XRE family transcriptional regulator [Pseudomonadota bacterium]